MLTPFCQQMCALIFVVGLPAVVDSVQMLSHGSADLILEACTDFWDGTDIYPLSGSDRSGLDFKSLHPCIDIFYSCLIKYLTCCFNRLCYRKKVLDFYQRACLSGYCSAFSYKPMHVCLSSQLNGKCIELGSGPSLFSGIELPSTTPIKHHLCRNSWSSDGEALATLCMDVPHVNRGPDVFCLCLLLSNVQRE